MKKFEGFYEPTAAKCDEITIFDQKTAIWDIKRDHGSKDLVQFLFKRYNSAF